MVMVREGRPRGQGGTIGAMVNACSLSSELSSSAEPKPSSSLPLEDCSTGSAGGGRSSSIIGKEDAYSRSASNSTGDGGTEEGGTDCKGEYDGGGVRGVVEGRGRGGETTAITTSASALARVDEFWSPWCSVLHVRLGAVVAAAAATAAAKRR